MTLVALIVHRCVFDEMFYYWVALIGEWRSWVVTYKLKGLSYNHGTYIMKAYIAYYHVRDLRPLQPKGLTRWPECVMGSDSMPSIPRSVPLVGSGRAPLYCAWCLVIFMYLCVQQLQLSLQPTLVLAPVEWQPVDAFPLAILQLCTCVGLSLFCDSRYCTKPIKLLPYQEILYFCLESFSASSVSAYWLALFSYSTFTNGWYLLTQKYYVHCYCMRYHIHVHLCLCCVLELLPSRSTFGGLLCNRL